EISPLPLPDKIDPQTARLRYIICKFYWKSERIRPMNNRNPRPERIVLIVFAAALMFMAAMSLRAQSSRPRRVAPTPTPTPDTLLGPPPKSSPSVDRNAPLLDVKPARPVGDAPAWTASNSPPN